ncbi:MAG: acyltransferase family protein [Methanobrevibacter sp.]|jgi:fucose 4-O-acetylase-like acetyltransferase|nr:acyltransferase family protein [Candidatus Methanoflexus mossambicus]
MLNTIKNNFLNKINSIYPNSKLNHTNEEKRETTVRRYKNTDENSYNKNNEKTPLFKKRLFKYDNMKGLAIIGVVLTHVINRFKVPLYRNIADLAAPVCMPLFFFVSGYFSKTDKNAPINAVRNILVPFFLFCTTWYIFQFVLFGKIPSLSKFPYLTPATTLWFLLSLFYLRLLLPVLIRIKYIFWISLLAALIIGLYPLPVNLLSVSRTLLYVPIFLLGYYFRNSDEYLQTLKPKLRQTAIKLSDFLKTNKKIIFVVLIVILVGLYFAYLGIPGGFVGGKFPYSHFDIGRKMGMLMRLFCISTSIIVVILINYITPNKKSFLTKLGRNSLSIYVLHFYFIEILENLFFKKTEMGISLRSDPIFGGIFIIVFSAILLFILSRDFIENNIRKLVKAIGNIMISDKINDKMR